MLHSRERLACAMAVCLLGGCGPAEQEGPRVKLPRPVTVITLQVSDPSNEVRLTGAAGSWKTEELAFEVAGRVQYVIEPETDIEGEVFAYEQQSNEDGSPGEKRRVQVSKGRELARIDPTRYELKVFSATAQINTLRQQREALRLDIEEVNPAERKTAEAELRFQQSELARITPLVSSGAITKSDFERTQANRDKAAASIVQIDATKTAKLAEMASIDAQIEEAQQTLKDAERDVQDTRLFSPFKGQIAEVHVTPGAFVNASERVLTVQMMDPIKVELEVSAEQSRRLTYKSQVDVVIDTAHGEEVRGNAIVYMIDPVADPSTRTFTVTLLMENTKVASTIPPELQNSPVVRTNDVWRFFKDKFGTKDFYLTEVNSIHEDEQGAYIWKIQNSQRTDADERVFDVDKVRVTAGELHLPFLGLWTFRELVVNDGEDFDPETDELAGPLTIPDELGSFDGGKVLFDRPRWLVRPGDLVSVTLSGEVYTPGLYVPMNVISEQSGSYFVHVVDGGSARRVEVNLFDAANTLRRIEAAGDGSLSDGTQLIAKGTHFVVDGEPVIVAEEAR